MCVPDIAPAVGVVDACAMVGTARRLIPSRVAGPPTSLLAQSAALAHLRVVEALAVADTRENHYLVLAALHDVGPVTVSELAHDLGLDRADVTATAHLLGRRGYLERTADDTDGRRVLFALTPEGTRQLSRLNRLVGRAQTTLFANLSERERAELTRLLTAVVTSAREPSTHESARHPQLSPSGK